MGITCVRTSERVDVEVAAEQHLLLTGPDGLGEAVLRRRHRAVVLHGKAAGWHKGAVKVEEHRARIAEGGPVGALHKQEPARPVRWRSSPAAVFVGSPNTRSSVPPSSNAAKR